MKRWVRWNDIRDNFSSYLITHKFKEGSEFYVASVFQTALNELESQHGCNVGVTIRSNSFKYMLSKGRDFGIETKWYSNLLDAQYELLCSFIDSDLNHPF